MARGNNAVPNGHFHKHWQAMVKTWFDQPMKKKRRALKRKAKAIRNLPKPIESLRPMVHCPTVRYNSKIRAGRGFSLHELKCAALNSRFARTIGIAVDYRKRNKSIEGMQVNIQRLKEYRSKLMLFSLNKKKQKEELKLPVDKVTVGINKRLVKETKLKARVPTDDEKKFKAFEYVRKARADAKYVGMRIKRKEMKADNIELPMKKVRLQSQDD